MHEKLFERVRSLVGRKKNLLLGFDAFRLSREGTPEFFAEMAAAIEGIDATQFLECMQSDKYSEKIATTTASFEVLGFSAVPLTLVDGKYFIGAPTREVLEATIENALAN